MGPIMAATDTSHDFPGDDLAAFYDGIGKLLSSYQEQVLAWQKKAIDVAFAQMSMSQAGVVAMVRAIDIQMAMLRALGAGLADVSSARGTARQERRTQSVVINFPDRRAA
jgi:hypothetical protein